jgi:hypothetical protein
MDQPRRNVNLAACFVTGQPHVKTKDVRGPSHLIFRRPKEEDTSKFDFNVRDFVYRPPDEGMCCPFVTWC